MLMEVAVHNSQGMRRGLVQLDLSFDKSGQKGDWEVQEVIEGDGWSKVSYSNPSQGTFEVKSWGVIWLWDKEPGNSNSHNIVILHDAPMSNNDYKDTDAKPGNGRIFDPKDPSFKDGRVTWKTPRMTPVREKVLEIIAGIVPPYPGFLPIPTVIDGSSAYTGHVTNCGVFPGWVARQLGYHLPGQSPHTTNKLGAPVTPHKIASAEFLKLNKSDRDKLSITSPMATGWSHDWGKIRSSFPKALERAREVPEGTIRKDYYQNPEMKKIDLRPKPGDIYTLVGNVPYYTSGVKKTMFGFAHVGFIVDSVNDVWKTADCGQCGKNAAAYKLRIFNQAAGTLILDPPESDNSVPDGGTRWLDGWIDIDELFKDWTP